jgi:uncharacterized protein YgiM (DUF1202 family)
LTPALAKLPDSAATSVELLSNIPLSGEATMARQGSKSVAALEAEARAHQHLVNIGEELKTVYVAANSRMTMKC